MIKSPHILIAGAGIGGLTAALALAQKGARVDVFEKAPALYEVGAGLQQSANAMHVHRALGIENAITAKGYTPQNAVLRAEDGSPRLSVSLGAAHEARYGAPYIHIHRADLHGILHRAAVDAGAVIHLGQTAIGYNQTLDDITLDLEDQRGTIHCAAGDALICAGGIRSALAQQVAGGIRQPRFTGQAAWRGIVHTSALPTGTISRDANAWLGGGRHCIAYYLRGGELINFVAVEERSDWTEESWSTRGDIHQLRAAFDGWDPALTTLLGACESTFLWGLFDHADLFKWTDGRAVLLGDACHPMLPFMAQGAAMAVEDAYVLAQEITQDGPNIQSALKRYEIARKPRTTRMQKRSIDNAAMFHHGPGLARTVRNAKFKIAEAIPAAQHSQFDWIYGWDGVEQ